MRARQPIRVAKRVLISAVLVVAATVVPARAAHNRANLPPLVIWPNAWTSQLTRNFNPCSNGSADTANVLYSAVYEPLYIIDSARYKEYPWLATSYKWSPDLTTLTFTIRHGVRWSDGQPFTAQDVYFTYATLPGAKNAGLCANPKVAYTLTMPVSDQVVFHFKTRDSTQLFPLMHNQGILPAHIYAKQANLGAWIQTNPVGTGPFTQVGAFTAQSFDVGKNPYYWQPGKPAFSTVREVIYTSLDAGNLALEAGQVDWGGSLIPRADRVYDSRNPNFHHFFPAGFTDDMLFLNTTRYPYNLVPFREALSLAMNRQAYNVNGRYGYGPPADIQAVADSTGATGPWPTWVDRSIPQTLTQYNPAAAKAMLTAAGFTYRNGGQLFDPKGHRVTMELLPTFTLGETQIMQQNFQAIGIDVSFKVLQYASFFDKMRHGAFDAVDGWNNGGPSPYYLYYNDLSGASYAPIGAVPTSGNFYNWERWTSPAMDALMAQYRLTIDPGRQHELVNKMEQLYAQELPTIPTQVETVAEEYNTTNYTGFPTAGDNYAYSTPTGVGPDTVLMLTRIHPSH